MWIPEHSESKKVLDQTSRRGTIFVLNTQGKAYTEYGFPTEFRKINNRLLREGKIGKVLTFHGLLHTVATKLADAGANRRTIQSITGHKTPEQVKAYVATVNKKRLAKKDMALIDGNKIRK